MKSFAIALLLLTSFASAQVAPGRPRVPSFNSGQSQTESGPTLKENYIITLTITEKDAPVTEYSLVVATLNFATTFPDSRQNTISFSATLGAEEDGGVLLSYVLGSEVAMQSTNREGPVVNQQVVYKSFSTQSSVRLRPGDSVVVVKNDARTCKLALTRVADTKGK